MARKSIAYRIILTFFLVAIVFVLPTAVWAQETSLTTTVPSSHILHIELNGEGTIIVDEVAYTKTADIQIQRQHRPEISILAADGSRIKTVLWDDEDIISFFQNRTWTAPEIINDASLAVTFEKINDIPQTGDTFNLKLWLSLFLISTFGIAVCLPKNKKEYI